MLQCLYVIVKFKMTHFSLRVIFISTKWCFNTGHLSDINMKIISIKASLLYHQLIFSFARSAAESTVVVSFFIMTTETMKQRKIY